MTNAHRRFLTRPAFPAAVVILSASVAVVAAGEGSSLGRIKFGSATSAHYRKSIEAPFFARFLKDKTGWNVPEATTFQTGTNAWQVYDEWPPRRLTEDRGLYFREGGRLAFEAPEATGDAAHFQVEGPTLAHRPARARPLGAGRPGEGEGPQTGGPASA